MKALYLDCASGISGTRFKSGGTAVAIYQQKISARRRVYSAKF